MLVANLLLSFASLATLLLAVLILIANSQRLINRLLAIFVLFNLVWLLTNLFANLSPSPAVSLFFARGTLIGGLGLAYTFWLFCMAYTRPQQLTRRAVILWGLPALLIGATFPTKLNIVSIDAYGANTVTGPIYFLLLPSLVTYFAVSYHILRKYSKTVHNPVERARVRYIDLGMLLMAIPGVFCNALLPAVGYTNAVFYGPIPVIFLAGCVTYAIIRHRLLDIRPLVARAMAYALALAATSSVYAAIIFGFSLIFSDNTTLAWDRQLVNLFPALILVFTYAPLKRFFDRFTNKYFYQDAYNTQDFVDQLNKVLVSTVEPEGLLKQASLVFVGHLKSEFCVFMLRETKHLPRLVAGTKQLKVDDDDQAAMEVLDKHYMNTVVVADELPDRHADLRRVLKKYEVDLCITLGETRKTNATAIGYLFIGPKKSGNMYGRHDLQVVSILADGMVIAIQNALRFEEIANFNKTLQSEVDHATIRLRHANQRLKTLDQLKDDFISMASHQFRTPAGSIRQALHMLNNDQMSAKERKEMMHLAEADSEDLVTLVGTMLNISRLQAGRFTIDKKAVDLIELLGRILSTVSVLAERKNVTLVTEEPEPHILAMVDEPKIREAMTNYIENAIKYSPSKSTVTIRLYTKDDRVYFEVLDQGIGVPEAERTHLFGRFYRAQNARNEHPDGNGIGLYVVKSIVEGHTGKVEFQPLEPGPGSSFSFWIPLADRPAK